MHLCIMQAKYYIVNAFASSRLTGNPAAVVFLSHQLYKSLPDKTFASIAKHFNLSETAFLGLRSTEDTFDTATVCNVI